MYRAFFFWKIPLHLIFWKNNNSIWLTLQFCPPLASVLGMVT